ncbi:MAG: hypothetical protein PHF74_07595 [Dehalococcoidales bacterium]|nr:hypothetical protein [Dehalococcoidales bacterium]
MKKIFNIPIVFTLVITGTIGASGMGVLATDLTSSIESQITIDDLIKISDKELSEVPQATITYALNSLYESGEKVWAQYEEKDILRIMDQHLINAKEIMFEEIAALRPTSTKSTDFDIGYSVTVNWAEDGDSGGYGEWGWTGDANYNVGTEMCESMVWVVLYGEGYTWARTGHTFDIGGTGSGSYRIDMDCEWICTVLGGGTCTLSLLIEKWEDGDYDRIPFEIDRYTAQLGEEHDPNFEYSTPLAIRLEAGGTYRISLLVETEASTVASSAGADCMTNYYQASWDYLHLEYTP